MFNFFFTVGNLINLILTKKIILHYCETVINGCATDV